MSTNYPKFKFIYQYFLIVIINKFVPFSVKT